MKYIFFILSILFNTSLYAEWIYVDTATGQGEGQQSWIWKTYSTSSNKNYRKFKMLNVMPAPLEKILNSATMDVEVYCNDPTTITMSNFKYFTDKKGTNIVSKFTDNKSIMNKTIPTYTPGYKAVRMVCNI
tara:strand:- start:405 stop:797 length:393 start_codon:yes stop_codon:yes gene_type:complete